jgi:hypothetical protein
MRGRRDRRGGAAAKIGDLIPSTPFALAARQRKGVDPSLLGA